MRSNQIVFLPETALIFFREGKLAVVCTPSTQWMDRCRSTVRWSPADKMTRDTGRYAFHFELILSADAPLRDSHAANDLGL